MTNPFYFPLTFCVPAFIAHYFAPNKLYLDNQSLSSWSFMLYHIFFPPLYLSLLGIADQVICSVAVSVCTLAYCSFHTFIIDMEIYAPSMPLFFFHMVTIFLSFFFFLFFLLCVFYICVVIVIAQLVTSYFYLSVISIGKLDVLHLSHLLLCIMTEVCISFNILLVIYLTEFLYNLLTYIIS